MKIFCNNCSLKCIASDCDCLCHTQNKAFNYGYQQGIEDEIRFLRDVYDYYSKQVKQPDKLIKDLSDRIVELERLLGELK